MAQENALVHVKSLAEFEALLEKSKDRFVVVDFWATWCGPCKAIAPQFEYAAKEHPNVVFVKVDVDEAEELSDMYKVKALPTFKIFKDKKVLHEYVGGNPEGFHKFLTNLK